MSVIDKEGESYDTCALHLLFWKCDPGQDTDGRVRIVATEGSSEIQKEKV